MEFGLSAEGLEERQRQLLFVRGGPRRTAENGNGNFFLSTKGRGGPRKNGNGNFFLSAEGHGGPRRTATSFCPRRATEDRGERQLLFVREGPRRTAKKGNGNFFLSTKGHEGPRRTATATSFCPRRATEDRGERQLLFVHEGPRRTAENEGHGGPRKRQLLFVRGGPRRTAENGNFFLSTKGHEGPRRTATATSFCPRRATKDREERQLLFVRGGPRRAAENGNGNFGFFLSAEGRGEHLLWLRQIMVVGHEDQARNGPILPAGSLCLLPLTPYHRQRPQGHRN